MCSNSSISVAVDDGVFDCYVARPATPGPHPVVIVLQEIFGVNEGIRSIAHDYAAKDFIAVCPDLFWRTAPGLSLSEQKPDDVARGFALYDTYDLDAGVRDIAAVIAAARVLPGANGKVGVTGYCLGGLLTYLSAARIRADACVAYYGGGTDHYLGEAANIQAPLLYHVGTADEYIGPAAQAAIRAALAGRPGAELYLYPERQHAFARPGGNHFDAGDAALANARTDAFLRRHLASLA